MRIVFEKNEVVTLKRLARALGAKEEDIENGHNSSKIGYSNVSDEEIFVKVYPGFICTAIDLFERKFVPMINIIKNMANILSKDKELKDFSERWFGKKEVELPTCFAKKTNTCEKFADCKHANECVKLYQKNHQESKHTIIKLPSCFGKEIMSCTSFMDCKFSHECMKKHHEIRKSQLCKKPSYISSKIKIEAKFKKCIIGCDCYGQKCNDCDFYK